MWRDIIIYASIGLFSYAIATILTIDVNIIVSKLEAFIIAAIIVTVFGGMIGILDRFLPRKWWWKK